MGIHIERHKKIANKRPRTSSGRFRRLTRREMIERGLRRPSTSHNHILHDENEDIRRARMKRENIVALVALVKYHPDRMPVWLKEFLAAGGPKGPAGA